MDKEGEMRKRGQIAIFVIVAVVIVATIILLFFILDRGAKISLGDEFNPKSYIERCARKATEEAIDKMLPQGGFVEPKNYKIYNDKKIEYICQNKGNYYPCVNQHPMFLNEMKTEIANYGMPMIEQCFSNLKNEMEKRNYDVELGMMDIDVSFGPDRVFLDLIRKIKLTKNDEVQSFDNLKIEIISPLYNLGLVAIEIASQEAKYCYFEYVGYMILYPRFSIDKFAMSDSTKIYSIKDKKTEKELNIAIRSCAIPPGI